MLWMTSPGFSTSVCGIIGSCSGSVYSWMSRSFWTIRPDWDLSAPGLREAWDAGDLSAFHGWSRWAPERASAARSV